jgi:hypothetical protein
LLESPETCATTLHAIMLAAYGEEVYTADPLTLYRQLEDDFRCRLPEAAENRINALFFALTTDAFYHESEAFSAIAASLYDGTLGDGVEDMFDALTMQELVWALYEVRLNREDEESFSPEVDQFIAETLQRETEAGKTVDNFLDDMKVDLHAQLAELGVPAEDLHYYLT